MAKESDDPRPLQYFPVDISYYEHHSNLDTATEVEAIGELLAPFGAKPVTWDDVSETERNSQEITKRLKCWSTPDDSCNTFLYWVGHGKSEGSDHAWLTAVDSEAAEGILPEQVLNYIEKRQSSKRGSTTWAVVVIDACKSARFVELMSSLAYRRSSGPPKNVLLVATSNKGQVNLGHFRAVLSSIVNVNFATEKDIDLAALYLELSRLLNGPPVVPFPAHIDGALRRATTPGSRVGGITLDQLPEIEAVLNALSNDDRHHFIPKASGTELGEQSWYFEGRESECSEVLSWLDRASSGMLIVTGAAGSGKSALLGNILVQTRQELRRALERTGHLAPLPDDAPRPQDPFTCVMHLSGLTPAEVVARIADAADLDAPPIGQSSDSRAAWLIRQLRRRNKPLTLLVDALDEASLPLVIAGRVLRPLAALPRVRVVVGTRRSTREGPDLSQPAVPDLLDTLNVGAATSGAPAKVISLGRDPAAITRYVRRRLIDAARKNVLAATDASIDEVANTIGSLDREFLFARLAVHEIIQTPELLNNPAEILDRDHRQLFARAVDRIARQLLSARPLLLALALARGQGLPLRDGIWAGIATALSEIDGRIEDSTIEELTKAAAPYLMIDVEAGQTVYRLAHRTFSEYFIEQASSAMRAQWRKLVVDALIEVGRAQTGLTVNPYLANHLAGHVADATAWVQLADSPAVLDKLDPGTVTDELLGSDLGGSDIPAAIRGMKTAGHILSDTPVADRAAIRSIEMARLAAVPPRVLAETQENSEGAWRLLWARTPPHAPHTTVPGPVIAGPIALATFPMPDGRWLVAIGGKDGKIQLWNPFTGRAVGDPMTGHTERVTALVAVPGPDGQTLLASGSQDKTLRLWDLHTGRIFGDRHLADHVGAVRALAAVNVSKRTVLLANFSERSNHRVRLWNTTMGREVDSIRVERRGHRISTITTVPIPGGRTLLITGGNDKTVRRWDPASGQQFGDPLTGHEDRVHVVTAVPMQTGPVLLASYSWDNTIRLWEPATGKLVACYKVVAHTGRINAMTAVSMPGDDCTVLATAGSDGTVQLCDPLTGRPLYDAFTEHEDAVYSLSRLPAPDGQTLVVSASSDGTVRTWHPGSRSSTAGAEHIPHIGDVAALPVAEEGTLIASTGTEPGVSLWNLATGEHVGIPLGDRSGPMRKVVALPISTTPDVDKRRTVLAYVRDKSVRLWNLTVDRQVGDDLTGHTDPVTALTPVLWPDGQTLLASASEDSIRLWEPHTGEPVGDAFHDPGSICCLTAFSQLGERVGLVSVDTEGMLRLWNPVTHQLAATVCTEHLGSVNVVVATRDSAENILIATGGADGTVRIWRVADDELCPVATVEHGSPVVAMTELLFPDGDRLLVIASNDRRLRVLDPASGQAGRALSLLIKVDSLTSSANRIVIGSRHGLFVLHVDKDKLETSPSPVDLESVDGDLMSARDIEDLYEYQSTNQRPGTPRQDQTPWPIAPAGLEELHNEHLDAKLGIPRLSPGRISEVRRWLRLAVTPSLTAENSWGAAGARQLLRRLGKAAVTLEIHANVVAESDAKEQVEQTRRMLHPVCATAAKELMLHERLASAKQEGGDTDLRESALDLTLQVFGVLALHGLDEIQARLVKNACASVTAQWSQVDRRGVFMEDTGDVGTQPDRGVTATIAAPPLLPRQVLLAADRAARQFGLSNGNSRFQQALVDPSWSPDSGDPVPTRQTNASLVSFGFLVVNELYLRAALRAILARPGTRIQEVGDVDAATLLPLFDDIGLHDGVLFTSRDPSSSADPNAMVDAVLAIFAAAYLSHDSKLSALSRNLPESVNAWLNMSTAPTYSVSNLLETRQPDNITRHSESPPRREQVTRMEGTPRGKSAQPLPGKVYKSNRNNRGGLTISRIPGERFFVGDDITIEITQVVNNKVRLKVKAPESMPIEREEIAKGKEENGHE